MLANPQSQSDQIKSNDAIVIQSGSVLGQYEVLELIGEGGFGCVYRARHTMMDRLVALKVISPSLANNTDARNWFLREVRTSTKMLHPNIVTAFDADDIDGKLFMAMEYIDGGNLEQFVRRSGPLPIMLACDITRQAAAALQHGLENGLTHRDVKPANLLMVESTQKDLQTAKSKNGATVKLTDFGIARLSEHHNVTTIQLKHSKSLVGTPHYISPEQARNVHDADIRSDLYSLGCTLYFMLAGREPFQGASVLEIITQHYERQAIPLDTIRSDVPPAVAQVVRSLMAKDPKQRPQTPVELIDKLHFACVGVRSTAFMRRPTTDTIRRKHVKLSATVHSNPEVEFNSENAASRTSGPSANNIKSDTATRLLGATQSPADGDSEGRHSQKEPVHGNKTNKERKNTSALDSLQTVWRNWNEIVQQITFRKPANTTETAYRKIHTNLVAQLRNNQLTKQKAIAKKLLATVEPWVSLQSLQTADRATCAELASRCNHFESQLGLGGRSEAIWQWVAALSIGVTVIACLLLWLPELNVPDDESSIRSIIDFAKSNTIAVLAIVVPLVVFALSFVASRFLRS